MARPVDVRDAHPEDMPALVDLWSQLREQGLRWLGRTKVAEQREAVEARFRAAMDDPAYRLVVACADEQIVGMALLTLAAASPLRGASAVEVTHVCVNDRHRRRGAGKALLAAAVGYAEEHDCENVVVAVLPHYRDAHRFYARLGFAPVAVRRVAQVGALRRRLGRDDVRVTATRRRRRTETT